MICTFFGHSDCYELDTKVLQKVIEDLIIKGVDTFYVGHQGYFDSMVLNCLTKLRELHPNISYSVVLAYLPTMKSEYDLYHGCSMYPEGLELWPLRFAIERRNKWMIAQANYCLCYITHPWGGAYKFAKQAKRKDLMVINLGGADL